MNSSRPSLKWILAGVFGLLVLLQVALLSFTVELVATRQMDRDSRSILNTLAKVMADRLDGDLFERYSEIILATDTWRLLDGPQSSLAAKRSLLETLLQTHPNYVWLGVADPTGKVVVATAGLMEGADVSRSSWFQQGRTAAYLGGSRETMLPASATGEASYYVALAAPIYADTGELVGVMGAYLDWTQLQDSVSLAARSLYDEQRLVVFAVTDQGELIFGPADWGERRLELPSPPALAINQGTFEQAWPDGNLYVAGIAPIQGIRTYSALALQVLVRQPAGQAYQTAQRIRWSITGIGALYALLSLLVVWWMADRLTRQLQAITNAANRIRHGESNVVIPKLTGSDEVAVLSSSLNQMIEELTTATVAERNRIARDLHDSVTQTLFSATLLADALPRVWELNPERGKSKLEELRRTVHGALAEMRTLLLELRPSALIDTEMERLLRHLADATSVRSGVAVSWQIEGICSLPPDVKVVFYRTVQESLSNVVKHADASQVDILLRCAGRHSVLTIRDDGCGFSPADVTGDHFGLTMMRERIHAVGGALHIHSQPAQGTEIQVVWPDGQR